MRLNNEVRRPDAIRKRAGGEGRGEVHSEGEGIRGVGR